MRLISKRISSPAATVRAARFMSEPSRSPAAIVRGPAIVVPFLVILTTTPSPPETSLAGRLAMSIVPLRGAVHVRAVSTDSPGWIACGKAQPPTDGVLSCQMRP